MTPAACLFALTISLSSWLARNERTGASDASPSSNLLASLSLPLHEPVNYFTVDVPWATYNTAYGDIKWCRETGAWSHTLMKTNI